MCGRFQIAWPWAEIIARYGVANPVVGQDHPDQDCVPRFNVCPTYLVPVVRQADGQRQLVAMRWGFPALWLARRGKDPWSRQLINAQAETAAQKPTWRRALRERRCLVPATGFYEWLGGRKTRRKHPLLWERSDQPDPRLCRHLGHLRQGRSAGLAVRHPHGGTGPRPHHLPRPGPCESSSPRTGTAGWTPTPAKPPCRACSRTSRRACWTADRSAHASAASRTPAPI